MCMGVLLAYVCVLCACSACRGQKRASDALEPELQTDKSCFLGVGTRAWVLWKSSRCSYPPNHLSSPSFCFLQPTKPTHPWFTENLDSLFCGLKCCPSLESHIDLIKIFKFFITSSFDGSQLSLLLIKISG